MCCTCTQNNIRDTCVVYIYIYIYIFTFKSVIFITCEHKWEIMVKNTEHSAAVQNQKTVSAYFTSKQILPFGFE